MHTKKRNKFEVFPDDKRFLFQIVFCMSNIFWSMWFLCFKLFCFAIRDIVYMNLLEKNDPCEGVGEGSGWGKG